MLLFLLFIDSKTLHVSGVTRPSSGVQETLCSLVLYSIILDSVFLFVMCCVCAGFWWVLDWCVLVVHWLVCTLIVVALPIFTVLM